MITQYIYLNIWIYTRNKVVKIKMCVNFDNLYALILWKSFSFKTFIEYVKKSIYCVFPTHTLYFLYTNNFLYNQCAKYFYLFFIHHWSIYMLDRTKCPFFSKICCSIGLNVPFHIKNASVKFQWNRFISRCSTKLLKNAFLLKKT